MFKRANKTTRAGSQPRADGFGGADGIEDEIAAWVAQPRPLFGEVALGGYITADDLTLALRYQHDHGGRLGEILVRAGRLDEHQVAAVLSVQFEIPLVDLSSEELEPAATEMLTDDLARRHHALPLRVRDGRLDVVVSDPLDTDAIRALTAHAGRIALVVGAAAEIDSTISQAYDELADAGIHIKAFELVDAGEHHDAESETLAVDDNAPVVQVVNRIIIQGVRSGASDIHIEATEHDLRVRYRIDGALSDAIRLPKRMGSPLSSRIKVLAELNIVERRKPQDGQFSTVVDERPIDVRTSVVATVHGEKIVLRILDKTRSLISLRELGMPREVAEPYTRIVKAPLGMMLCTGPTGSGKTTTLYATLTEVNDDAKNVVTIEDPVEYYFDGISQMQISEAAGITFADGLRGILRQDPDVILVGEIRDVETARIATQAALTGHFVLSSLHAIDAVSALHRFTDMGIEPFLVASAINGVIGQRLVRKTCTACRVPYQPTSDHIRLVATNTGGTPKGWFRGAGCKLCNNTGYRGRVGVYELLQVSEAIRELIVTRATHGQIRDVAIDEGMRTMQSEAFRLVREGVTTVDEVLRSVYAPSVEVRQQVRALGPGPAGLRAAPMPAVDDAANDDGDRSTGPDLDLTDHDEPAEVPA